MISVNSKRGLLRLAIAILVPYFGWWIFIWRIATNTLNAVEQRIANLPASSPALDTLLHIRSQSQADLDRAFVFGMAIPVLAIILSGIAFWIYRGFRPSAGMATIPSQPAGTQGPS